jgi:hypothetical protein
VLGEAAHDRLDPGVEVLIFGEPGVVGVIEEGTGTPGVMYQRRSGTSSCVCMRDVLLQSPNMAIQLASTAAAIPAEERS